MRENYRLAEITPDIMPLKVVKAKKNNARLVQMCAVNTEKGYDLLYSFANEYNHVIYKISIGKDEQVVSISDIYPAAALYENEMRELFGVKIEYLNLDYHERLYSIDEKTPFRPETKEAE